MDTDIRRPQFDVPLPERMRGLHRDHRGFVVPFFVAWYDADKNEVEPGKGEPDFRILNPVSMIRCVRDRVCWCCGQPMGANLVFAIGPMCAATRTTMEPPAHYECARYSVMVCPFLSNPAMRRHEKDMPEGHWAPGFTIARNPGVIALWVTKSYKRFNVEETSGTGGPKGGGVLITVGEPLRVEWWARGRQATRAEVEESINTGLPILRAKADEEGPRARYDLEKHYIPRLNAMLPP